MRQTMVTLINEQGDFITMVSAENFCGNVGDGTSFSSIEGTYTIIFNYGCAAVVQRRGHSATQYNSYIHESRYSQQWER